MTFDDGILSVYQMTNTASSGAMPVMRLTLQATYYFGYDVLGFTRYYTAMQAKQQIDTVVNVPDWIDVSVNSVIVLDGSTDQYRVSLVQRLRDDNNLKMTKLTLGRMDESYVINS